MTTYSMPPAGLLDHLASADVDARRIILQHTLHRLIEAEATASIGAAPGEHTPQRRTYRNGHRARPLETRMGRLEPQLPKLRTGSFFPSLLERSSRRPTSTGSAPARWTTWWRPWAAATCPGARSAASAPSWTRTWRPSANGPWTTPLSPTSFSTLARTSDTYTLFHRQAGVTTSLARGMCRAAASRRELWGAQGWRSFMMKRHEGLAEHQWTCYKSDRRPDALSSWAFFCL